MSFQRIHFEAILEKLKGSITLNTPVPTNMKKAKNMNDYFVELLEDQRKRLSRIILSRSYSEKY